MKKTLLVIALLAWGGPLLAGAPQATLERIRASGELILGYREDTPPFSFVDEAGNPAGFSVDLCRYIAAYIEETLGGESLKLRYVRVNSENRFDSVASGKVDIECGATTNTLERQRTVDFTHTIFITGGTLLTTAAAGVKTVSDLQGKSVAVVKGTTTEKALDDFLGFEMVKADIVRLATHAEAMRLLNAGDVVAYAADQAVLAAQVMDEPEQRDYAMIDNMFSYEPYALVVRRGDPDFRLAANTALSRLFADEQIVALYKKWFGQLSPEPHRALLTLWRVQALPQ